MLIYRVLSALVGIPVSLLLVWYGGLPLAVAVFIIAVLGILEMGRIWSKMGVRIWLPGAITTSALLVGAAYWDNGYLLGFAFFVLVASGAFYLAADFPSFGIKDLSATIFAALYAGWLLIHLLYLRLLPDGFSYLLLVVVSTWTTDTFAYFTGMNFGRRKLAPALSPKKSIEGAVGGVVGSIAASVLLGHFAGQLAVYHYVILGLLIGTIGQVGDLVESAFKRMAGVKDSGDLIPGHGGILDRFDSLLMTAPVVFYYLKIIGI